MLENKLDSVPRVLRGCSRERTLTHSGAYVHQQGDNVAEVSIITKGRAFRMHHSPHETGKGGEGRIVDICGPGDVLGLHAYLGQGKHIDTICSQTAILVMHTVDYGTLNRIRAADNDARRFLDCEIAEVAARDLETGTRLALLPPERRILLLLADLAERFGASANSATLVDDTRQMTGHLDRRDCGELVFDIGLSQAEIAQMVGCSREHVSRLFASLKRSGLIRDARDGSRTGSYVVNVHGIRKAQG